MVLRATGQAGGVGAALFEGDLTARALAAAGLAALLSLPLLLLSSIVFAAPLAVPAAIGLGYLAVSHALAAQRHRRAAFINAAVLFGLVSWLLLFLLTGDEPTSRYGLTAALLAPLFAAAPAFARSLMAKRAALSEGDAAASRDAALERAASLDERMPSKRVLILDAKGTELALDVDAAAEAKMTASLSPCGDGTVAMRLQPRPTVEPAAERKKDKIAAKVATPGSFAAPSCDIGPAVAFAFRHVERKAVTRKVLLTSTADADLAVLCDRQIGRRILTLLTEAALSQSEAGGAVDVVARRLKGIVLLRVASAPRRAVNHAAGEYDGPNVDTLRALVEDAGGTLIVDGTASGIAFSVRLPRAAKDMGAERE